MLKWSHIDVLYTINLRFHKQNIILCSISAFALIFSRTAFVSGCCKYSLWSMKTSLSYTGKVILTLQFPCFVIFPPETLTKHEFAGKPHLTFCNRTISLIWSSANDYFHLFIAWALGCWIVIAHSQSTLIVLPQRWNRARFEIWAGQNLARRSDFSIWFFCLSESELSIDSRSAQKRWYVEPESPPSISDAAKPSTAHLRRRMLISKIWSIKLRLVDCIRKATSVLAYRSKTGLSISLSVRSTMAIHRVFWLHHWIHLTVC